MKLRNMHLVLANVARTTGDRSLQVNSVSIRNAIDGEGHRTEEVVGYNLNCAARKGDTLTVKFPLSVKTKFEELKKLLDDDAEVTVSFTNLKLTAYALQSKSGELLSGVSAKEDDFKIENTHLDDDDFADEIDL